MFEFSFFPLPKGAFIIIKFVLLNIEKGSSFKTNEAEERLMEVILNRWIFNYCDIKIWINSDFHPPQASEIPYYCDDITIYIHDVTSKRFHSPILPLLDVSFPFHFSS